MSEIFVQIASYCDPQLVSTVQDCIDKSKNPKDLVFCIAWQHRPDEKFGVNKRGSRIEIIDIPYKESKGACWARNRVQQHYDGETYTLQLDSHHRFIQNWDEELILMHNQLKKKGYKKPLITSYLPSFNPNNDPNERVQVPWQMNFDRFIPEGAVFFLPASIPNNKNLKEPIPARFYSAHFCFADGTFCKEVPHDPEYYFHGEEISIAVRSYTHGYDLFHPHKVIAWHEYTRKGRTKHWDDDKTWYLKNAKCHQRNRKLFGMDNEKQDIDFDPCGFGTERTLKDYERYAGLCFRLRSVQQYTLNHLPPPNPTHSTEEEFQNSFTRIFKHCIDVHKNKILQNLDYDFWAVIFADEHGKEINRQDLTRSEIDNILNTTQPYYQIWREFLCSTMNPRQWIVWPHLKNGDWGDKITGTVGTN